MYNLFKMCVLCSRWYKDGTQLKKSQKYKIDIDAQTGILLLVIKNADEADAGQYECEVTLSDTDF